MPVMPVTFGIKPPPRPAKFGEGEALDKFAGKRSPVAFGHAQDTVHFSGQDHKPYEVIQAHNILSDVAAAFRENPDTLFPKGFYPATNVNKGFYQDSWKDPFPGSMSLGNVLANNGGRRVPLSAAYQRWAEQAADTMKTNLMNGYDYEVIPFGTLFNLEARLPDGRKVRMMETVDVDPEALARAKAGERVQEGLGERSLHITVTRGKETLDDITLKGARHVDELSGGMEKLIEAWIAWKPGAGITPEIDATVEDVLRSSLIDQGDCMDCACKEDKTGQ